MSETIIAQCTPQGPGALALIRISGPNACAIADSLALFKSGKQLAVVPSHTIHSGMIRDGQGTQIDHVLFLVMRAPHTFTGEDTVEITCHNNQFIIERIIESACLGGARGALPGEFSQQAFTNGKIDLLQAEGINELIAAPSVMAAKAALAQVKGSLSGVMLDIEQRLVEVCAWVEASFDFLDEEQRDLDFGVQIQGSLNAVLAQVTNVLSTIDSTAYLREGVRIALVGSVNAGKSTLLNRLLGKERALVSEQAGTTRDTIEASMSRQGYTWTFIDTAGIRSTDDAIERAGIERSYREAKTADLIIVLIDQSREITAEEMVAYATLLASKSSLILATKADLVPHPQTKLWLSQQSCSVYGICAVSGEGVAALQQLLFETIVSLHARHETPYLLNKRQVALLGDIQRQLTAITGDLVSSAPYELIAARLQDTLGLLTQLTGHNVSEAVMDKVFRSFCVGK